MNLDRFAIGLRDAQSLPEVAKCTHCYRELYQEHEAIRYEGDLFCDTHCLAEHLLETVEYEEVIL
ncbi:hypothetical protein GFC29_3098 [Anoxybacillus sp. B7M1]|uniref:hypothetical protein n=1 Tax=unclassified Anoxybacillus TaxID=2639704 RepID=UPI0005CDAF86|nr:MULTISPECIES: hypothetical protein [unclassified Anoxybacillus]ANB57472.1 hypothetical protein GFC28_2338 [Anoxybacillus sp. B2M1]ANB65337.1 hypothetical protein GFC29_3098 [Anoxybacillus sp. B7M1]OQM47508.1 hypothetical protein B6A27_00230 [Anoxybacillus sp. UARK-01]